MNPHIYRFSFIVIIIIMFYEPMKERIGTKGEGGLGHTLNCQVNQPTALEWCGLGKVGCFGQSLVCVCTLPAMSALMNVMEKQSGRVVVVWHV